MHAALAVLQWAPDPIAFEIGPVTVRWYGMIFGVGFLLAFWVVRSMYARERKPVDDVETLLVTSIIGTIIGARLVHCLAYEPARYLADPVSILRVWEGGLASHGGMLGIVLALGWHSLKKPDQPFLWLLDRVAVASALTGGMVRIGNFFNSEIIGKPTDGTWGVVFSTRDHLPRHPAQLYEAAAYLALFAFLFLRYRKLGAATPRGHLVGLFLVLCFSARIAVEFVKTRQEDFGENLPFTMGQALSVPVVLVGFWLLARARRAGPPAKSAPA